VEEYNGDILTVACFEMTSGDKAFSFVKSICTSSAGTVDEVEADAWMGSLIDSDILKRGVSSARLFRCRVSWSFELVSLPYRVDSILSIPRIWHVEAAFQ
jgi:hypothetical protein